VEMQEVPENGQQKTFFKNSRVQKLILAFLIYLVIALFELFFLFHKVDFDRKNFLNILKNANFSCI
jgi:hypothetical protein